ncbi:MAG: DNA topoisomerase I [Nanoarchaeota archaeon]
MASKNTGNSKSSGSGYVPLDESSIKRSLTIPEKPKVIVETIEKQGKIMPRKTSVYKKRSTTKSSKPKSSSSSSRFVGREPPVKRVGKGDYVLVITEKPQAASKIADGLGNARKVSMPGGVFYYEVTRGGEKLVVACAVGHLFGLQQSAGQKSWPVFNLEWVPSYSRKGAEFTKKYYNVLRKLATKAKSLVVATDYDIEGEVIGWNIVRFICGEPDAKRMKFSSLTKDEISKSYDNVFTSIDWGQAFAGETRHYLDWLYGINLSRALMEAIKKAGNFRVMSIGRVQGPALNLVVKKELEISSFKPEPFWQVFLLIDWQGEKIELKYVKDITNESELKKFSEIAHKHVHASTFDSQQSIPPLPLFDLTTLQTESYKFFGLTPTQSLAVAQKLYLSGLISYPRTSSQKLPAGTDVSIIVKKLSRVFSKEASLVSRNWPVESNKTDPAHPAIHPTGELTGFDSLSSDESKIYGLVVKRFLASLCDDALVSNRKIEVVFSGLVFNAKGLAVLNKGWTSVYPHKLNERDLPEVNGEVDVLEVRIEQKETQPPKRYSPASLVSELAKRNLGTKATRAAIVETLYDRGYIKDRSVVATPIGVSLINTLEKYCPVIIDEKLTRDFEKETNAIFSAKKDFLKKEEVIIGKVKNVLLSVEKEFRKSEVVIGKELLDSLTAVRQQEKVANTLSKCPVCSTGNLAILFSKKFGKSFVACNRYPDCKTTFGLPSGFVKRVDGKLCDKCSWQKLMLLKKGRRPWEFCFNPACPSRKEQEERQKQQEEEKEEVGGEE